MDCDDGSMDCWDDEAFIAIANELIDKCNLPGKVSRLEECRDIFFVGVYRGLVGDDLSGIIENPISVEQHIQNCQTVIDLVATDVLNVDLSHISGKGIVEGDKASIRNFLEIFAGLLEYFMECIDDKDSDDEHDSNLLTSEHDIISGVLREEFGPSYQAMYESRPRQSREEPKQLSEKQGQGRGHNRSLTRSTATAADSTACDADTSKLSDSRAGGVSDSTAELIRLGETSTDRSSDRKEPRDYLPDSTSSVPGPSALPPESSSVFSSNVYGDGEKGRKSVGGSGRSMSSNALNSQRAGSQKGSGNLASRDTTSAEDELTQYTLTPTELGDSSAAKAKSAHKNPKEPSPSFLSDSSTSAAWPEQISPLEPLKDSIRGGPGQFDALGVRPKEPPHSTGDTDSGSQVSSGRSTPVYHHYHHHFHHTQPQGRVPAFQSAAEMSAAASVDVGGPTNHLSSSDPTEPVTRAAQMLQNRLTQTTPNALTYPLSGSVYPSTAIPRSTAISSTQGLTHPPPAGVTGTTSTLTDSVFLSGSASSRTPVVTPSATGVASGAFVATSSLRDRLAMSTATKPSTGSSVPTSSSLPSTSYRPPGTTGSSVDERASVMERANKLADRLNSLSRGQSLASTFPERSSDRPQTRVTDLEPPIVPRYAQSTDPCLLANYSVPEADDNGSDSEREPEDEELAQNSDSAVDYGRISSATGARMRGKASLSRSSSRTIGRTETPRIPRAYKESTEDSSSERPPRRGVTFRDTVETFPVSGRMDRLRRLLYDEAEEKRKRHTKDMRKAYRDQLREIQQEQEREKASHQKRKMPVSPNVPKKKPKKKSPVKKNGGLQAVYRSQVRKFRPVRKTSAAVKERKRSASASPVRSRRTSDSTDHPDVLLPAMLEEFPFLHVSPQTARSMWQKQAQHLSSVFKSESEAKRTKTQRMIEEAERRQEALVGILKKDLDHNLRMREKQERQQQQRTVRAKLREKRQVSARARRYYDEYELRMRARMLKRRTQEEQIFKRVFEDGLDIQKQRIRELREYAKEKREALAQRQQNEIESLENFYRDQFAMLAEGIARERFEMEVREKAQEKVVRQMRKDLRHKLERDVKEFQENLQRDEDSAYFRQLDADRLRGKFQLATRSAFY